MYRSTIVLTMPSFGPSNQIFRQQIEMVLAFMEWLVTLPRDRVPAAYLSRRNGSGSGESNALEQQLIIAASSQQPQQPPTDDDDDDDDNAEQVLPPCSRQLLELEFDTPPLQPAHDPPPDIVIIEAWVVDLAKPMAAAYNAASEDASEDAVSDPSHSQHPQFLQKYFEHLHDAIGTALNKVRKRADKDADADPVGNEAILAALESAKAKVEDLKTRQIRPDNDHFSTAKAPIFCMASFRREVTWWKAVERSLREISSWFEPSIGFVPGGAECPATYADDTAVAAAYATRKERPIYQV